jgi:LmbE family N-acetylglucosaminyl deacetylase
MFRRRRAAHCLHLHAPRVVLGFEGPEDWAWGRAAEGCSVVVDTTDVWAAKAKALGCYRSQMRADPHPRSTSRIHALDVALGVGIGAGTAERFLPYRMVF